MVIRPLSGLAAGGTAAGGPIGSGGRRESGIRREGDTVSLGDGGGGAGLYVGKPFFKIIGAVELTSGEFDASAGS